VLLFEFSVLSERELDLIRSVAFDKVIQVPFIATALRSRSVSVPKVLDSYESVVIHVAAPSV